VIVAAVIVTLQYSLLYGKVAIKASAK